MISSINTASDVHKPTMDMEYTHIVHFGCETWNVILELFFSNNLNGDVQCNIEFDQSVFTVKCILEKVIDEKSKDDLIILIFL